MAAGSENISFDETIEALSAWTEKTVTVNITNPRYGADGYLADFSGRLTLVEEPEFDNESRITYLKFENSEGFAVTRAAFEGANRDRFGDLRIQLGGIELTVGVVQPKTTA